MPRRLALFLFRLGMIALAVVVGCTLSRHFGETIWLARPLAEHLLDNPESESDLAERSRVVGRIAALKKQRDDAARAGEEDAARRADEQIRQLCRRLLDVNRRLAGR